MVAFPIPVVAEGAGVSAEDEALDYLPMPKGMHTYAPPVLPEPQELLGLGRACLTLQQVLGLLQRVADTGTAERLRLEGLSEREVAVLNQVLGEGETSAVVPLEPGRLEVHVQEAIFTGVWRLMTWRTGECGTVELVDDAIEVGPVPSLFGAVAAQDVWERFPVWEGELPPNVQNAPLLLTEIRDRVARWQPGQAAHVVNLSLLPVSAEDIAFLDHHLGTGRIRLLARGYGNCRISNTRLPNCWRVVYYNSMDKVILNTVEVVDMPAVALAAPEDLRDSHARLADVLSYLESA
ncbi:hydrogenase expression/formation protein [uncultured Tepidimonas sp.]|uniref:hydrogenase expression/formation protein n=1 Tax=uncultured Tepidimonas sp. TaxID=453579 RepID=UPI0026020C85|nr:hydrogenase expression/formation protein [uncultured Tepidimonas sp.]